MWGASISSLTFVGVGGTDGSQMVVGDPREETGHWLGQLHWTHKKDIARNIARDQGTVWN